MGIVVEYAGQKGKPRWLAPPKELWDYTAFGRNDEAPRPDETIPMVFRKLAGGTGKFNHWTINGQTYEQSSPIPTPAWRAVPPRSSKIRAMIIIRSICTATPLN